MSEPQSTYTVGGDSPFAVAIQALRDRLRVQLAAAESTKEAIRALEELARDDQPVKPVERALELVKSTPVEARPSARSVARERATTDEPRKPAPKQPTGKTTLDTPQQIVATITRCGRFVFSEQLSKELARVGVEKGWRFSDLLKKMVAEGTLAKARYGTARSFTAYGLPEWVKREGMELAIPNARHVGGFNRNGIDIEITLNKPARGEE